MTSHAPYSCHHSHDIYQWIHNICVLTTLLHMVCEQLYVWHHTHFIYDTLCTMHNVTYTLWVHTIVVTTLHPLHSWHHTHYIRHHTHDNTKVISGISPSISDTTSTVSVSSSTVYQLYYTDSLNDITHYMYDITFSSVCMTSHEHFITSLLYRYDITSSIFMTSYPIYMISPILFHENETTIPGISPTLFDITATASVWSHLLYQCLDNNYGSLQTWHTYDIIYKLHHIKFRLYDINHQYLGHHRQCIHDIRSPLYDITSTL